ncbi:hypothetical protein GS579_14015 [Rhodococcus hoagii]|nr:hypothetical protein [Prescottella equi]
MGSGTLDANGTATYAWTPGTRGAHTLMAKFPEPRGPTLLSPASRPSTSLRSTRCRAHDQRGRRCPCGRASTLEATVSPAGAGGTVVFKDGSEVLAQVPVDGAGKATYQWTPTSEGSCTLVAVFSGRDGVGRVDRHRDRHGGGQARRQHRVGHGDRERRRSEGRFAAEHLRTGDPGQRRGNRDVQGR